MKRLLRVFASVFVLVAGGSALLRFAPREYEVYAAAAGPGGDGASGLAPDLAGRPAIRVDVPELGYFASEGRSRLLLRHLEASPEWKVFEDNGSLVAYRRKRAGEEWRVTKWGFWSTDEDGWKQTRSAFRFGPDAGGEFADQRRMFTRVAPRAGIVRLAVRRSDNQAIQSYLAVGEDRLWFEVYEETREVARSETETTLRSIRDFLANVRASEKDIDRIGYAAKAMPAGGVREGQASMQIADTDTPGIYDLCAWLNPGEAGYVHLKLIDVATGTAVGASGDDRHGEYKEYGGWSADRRQLFFYNGQLVIENPETTDLFQARFELWFHPSDGHGEREIAHFVRRVVAWQR